MNFVRTVRKEIKNYTKNKNDDVVLSRKCVKEYFHNATENNIVTNKKF